MKFLFISLNVFMHCLYTCLDWLRIASNAVLLAHFNLTHKWVKNEHHINCYWLNNKTFFPHEFELQLRAFTQSISMWNCKPTMNSKQFPKIVSAHHKYKFYLFCWTRTHNYLPFQSKTLNVTLLCCHWINELHSKPWIVFKFLFSFSE